MLTKNDMDSIYAKWIDLKKIGKAIPFAEFVRQEELRLSIEENRQFCDRWDNQMFYAQHREY